MTVHVGWHDSRKDTVLWTFQGRWTWNEYFTARASVDSLFDSLTYPVYCIYFFAADAEPPEGIGLRLKRRRGMHDAKIAARVGVGVAPALQRFWHTLAGILTPELRVDFCDTLDEAVSLIENRAGVRSPVDR